MLRSSCLGWFRRTLLILATFFVFHKNYLKAGVLPLEQEVAWRIEILKNYVPGESYHWNFHDSNKHFGVLEGWKDQNCLWTILTCDNGETLIFDKAKPHHFLYPNKLCLHQAETSGLLQIKAIPGLCYDMLAMPFLFWDVKTYSRGAKLGRKGIWVTFEKGEKQAQVFIDKVFNAILWVEENYQQTRATFLLKHFKRFQQNWSIGQAEFSLNGTKVRLYIDGVFVKK